MASLGVLVPDNTLGNWVMQIGLGLKIHEIRRGTIDPRTLLPQPSIKKNWMVLLINYLLKQKKFWILPKIFITYLLCGIIEGIQLNKQYRDFFSSDLIAKPRLELFLRDFRKMVQWIELQQKERNEEQNRSWKLRQS